MRIEDHLALLGMRVEDRVSGLKGVVTSVCFDLYGCIQATIHPGIDKDGKSKEICWYDIVRLKIVDKKPVMEPPDYAMVVPVIEGKKGPAEKPAFMKP